MCGIAGVIKIHEAADGPPPSHLEAIPEAWLDVLDDSIEHRGPDGQGRFRDRAVRDDGTVVDVALVHRRLSIIDHEGGHQPMVHDGERLRTDLTYQRGETPIVASEVAPGLPIVAVVFNGCIYNHRELRAELEDAGHVFATDHSDTEVLVHGWRAWQGKLQDCIDGMYTHLLWDRSTGQLASGRDLVGEKPLYSINIDGACVFGSSACSVIRCGTVADTEWRPFDKQFPETKDWIQSGWEHISAASWVYQQQTGEWDLLPREPCGEFVVERSKNRVATRKQRLATRDESCNLDTDRLDRLLVDSVRSRFDADVPVGVFLSGGIDSGLISAIARKDRSDVRAFTVRMHDPRFDESGAADESARHIGIEHHVLDCDPHPADDLVMLIERMGLPFGDSSLLPTYWVSKAAREHVKVALSGDGGDELFGGYRRHTIAPVLNRWRAVLELIPSSLLMQRRPGSRTSYLARLGEAARHGGYADLLAIFQTSDLGRLVRVVDDRWASDYGFRATNDPLLRDFTNYLPDDLLRKTDTASMAVGLEVRAPFLARELVETVMRTPLDVLMPNGERKGLLKRVARRYLPDHIVDRPKQGFAIPVGEWFRSDYGGMRQLLHDHMSSSDPFPGLGESGVEINMGFVRTMMREHDAAGEKSINPWHGRDHSQRLYMVLVLSIWAKWLDRVRRGAD